MTVQVGVLEKIDTQTVEDLQEMLEDERVCRAFIVLREGSFLLSHPHLLEPIKNLLISSEAFANHEGVFIGREPGIPTLFFAFVHDTHRGTSQGGVRLRPYDNLSDLFDDGLKLAQGMTRKNALAEIWWGGGKAIIPITRALDRAHYLSEKSLRRRQLMEAFGKFVAGLGGFYTTAEDVGTTTWDMNVILGVNRFTTCVGPELGGSGNPSGQTARGVLRGMQAAWQFMTGSPSLAGVRVAVQGLGNVGTPLVELLCEAGARVSASDDETVEKGRQARAAIQSYLPQVTLVPRDEIFDVDADIFAPCALGGVVNAQTIPRLKVRLVCGAANNILDKPEADAKRLRDRGIEFVPDFVCNRMGIVNCAGEVDGPLEDDVEQAVEKVFPETLEILEEAKARGLTSLAVANERADRLAQQLHPIHPHRRRRILDRVMARWVNDQGSADSPTHLYLRLPLGED